MFPLGKFVYDRLAANKTPPVAPQESREGSPFRSSLGSLDLFDSGTLDSFDGTKFAGGYGSTSFYDDGSIDYDTLRARSKELYISNLYAKGLINRIVDNVVNTGLRLQATPENQVLNLDPQSLQTWTDDIEATFKIWGADRDQVDHKKRQNFKKLQSTIYRTALLSGDCVVRLRHPEPQKLPTIEVIDGRYIQTPALSSNKIKNKIHHGVEVDSKGRHIAYWVRKDNWIKPERIPVFGEKSKRRLAWMVYGTEELVDHVRGISLLGCALQALKEVDRYTDSEIRAALVNSFIAVFIKRTPGNIGTPSTMFRSATKNETHEVTQKDGSTKESTTSEFLPGMVLENLGEGEEPVSFNNSRPNANYKEFTRAILAGIAWGQGIPPEILFLEFQNNFSASRQASNEFKMFLNLARQSFADQFLQLYWIEWLNQYAFLGLTKMVGYVESLANPLDWLVRGAWRTAKWIGVSRPSVDPLKEIKAYQLAQTEGYMSKSDVVTELRGDDFDKVLRRNVAEQQKEIDEGWTVEAVDEKETEETDPEEEETNTKASNLSRFPYTG